MTLKTLYALAGVILAGQVCTQPQATTRPSEDHVLETLIRSSQMVERSEWWPAVQELGRISATDETLRDQIWRRAHVNTLGMKFVLVGPGTFTMGPDTHRLFNIKWPHRVTITRPYYISVTEVTNETFQKLFPSFQADTEYSPDRDSPAVNIRWKDADRFCRELSQREGECYRLPTEAEWEYACRAGSKSRYCYGYSASSLGDYAWYDYRNGRASAVALLQPNNWGLYDMHGNAFEWVADLYSSSYYSECMKKGTVRDPRGPLKGWGHVLRGGGWQVRNPRALTSTARFSLPIMNRTPFDPDPVGIRETIGFRVVRELGPSEKLENNTREEGGGREKRAVPEPVQNVDQPPVRPEEAVNG